MPVHSASALVEARLPILRLILLLEIIAHRIGIALDNTRNDEQQRPEKDKNALQKPQHERARKIFLKALEQISEFDFFPSADAVGKHPKEPVLQRTRKNEHSDKRKCGRAQKRAHDKAGEQNRQPIILENSAPELATGILFELAIGYHKIPLHQLRFFLFRNP